MALSQAPRVSLDNGVLIQEAVIFPKHPHAFFLKRRVRNKHVFQLGGFSGLRKVFGKQKLL